MTQKTKLLRKKTKKLCNKYWKYQKKTENMGEKSYKLHEK